MTKTEQRLNQCKKLYSKNITFFEENEPNLYKFICANVLPKSNFEIVTRKDSDRIEVDILHKGKYKYFGEGELYCRKEADKFIELMRPGLELHGIRVANKESFNFKRIASIHLKELATIANTYTSVKQHYPMPSFYPLVVVLGVGLGYHIEQLLKNSTINNLIVYEKSIDDFITSFYTIDWEGIYSNFDPDIGTSIQIIIASNNNFNDQQAYLWNELIGYCPHFPFTTFFYNHLNDSRNKKIIDTINGNLGQYLHQWGHYDDEINQYNNARHNFLNGAKIYTPSKFKINPNTPVVVVAGGSSAEERIGLIKKYRENLIIISCGSAIGTLCHFNIKPDFHLELESDYLVYEAISQVTTPEFREGITLIGAAQLNPLCFKLFDKSLIFFKDSTALTELFINNENDILISSTPTCTNAGVSFARSLNVKSIYMLGTDFGFSNIKKHHAPGSIHYEDKVPKGLEGENDFETTGLIKVTSVHGQEIFTKPVYLTSKMRLEECIKQLHRSNMSVYNCSDGASIKNSKWLSNEIFSDKLEKHKSVNEMDINNITTSIYNLCESINIKDIDKKSQYLKSCIESIFKTIINRTDKVENLQDLTKYCFIINNIITKHVKNKMGSIHYFIRGHIWISLSIVYTMSLNLNDSEIENLFQEYKNWLQTSSEEIISEMNNIVFHKKDMEDDPWLHCTVETE